MAERELPGISPSYQVLCLGVAGDPALLSRLDTLPAPKRQPNLLLGSVRFLDGPVSAYPPFRAFVLDRWDELAATMIARRTQTNEARRCTAYLPVLAGLPGPLALLEVGASAGLCLFPDQYRYRYRTADGEHIVGDGPVELDCAVTGPAPLPDRRPEVVWRAGLDLHPLDVADPEDVRWLRSLIWPEQHDRQAILDAAVAVARADPPRIVTGDLRTDVTAVAAQAPAGATLVIFHAAVLAYLDGPDRAAFAESVAAIAADRPTVWLSNEAAGVVPGTDAVPNAVGRLVLARDGQALARAGPHGQSLDWIGTGAA